MTPELATLLTVAVVMSVAGSFAPVFSGEAFIAIAALTQPPSHVIAIAIAAAAGQTIGKAITFIAARAAIGRTKVHRPMTGLVHHPRRRLPSSPAPCGTLPGVRTRLAPLRRAVERTHTLADTAMAGAAARPVLLVSACVGLPPLLPVTIYAARSPMTPTTFVANCAAGRTIRMLAIATMALTATAGS